MKRVLIKQLRLCVGILGFFCSVAEANEQMSKIDEKKAFIEQLIQVMTLDEKIGQLRLISIGADMPQSKILEELAAGRIGGTFNSLTREKNRPLQEAALRSRLKIPMFFAFDVVHGHRTVFPISLGQAASWDLEGIGSAAQISAQEASADGIDMTFAPMVDIARDPRWGRTSEGFGEDPYLVSQIAKTMVQAYQGNDLSASDRVMAVVKHFALYGAVEGGRDYNTVDMSPLRMHQEYFPPYKAAIQGGAGGVMVALNSINGVPATANTWLMQDLLRKDWGFNGIALSDHGAIAELIKHGVAKDGREAAKLALRAGISMSMHDSLYLKELPNLIQSGDVSIEQLNQAVREVLGAKYDMGLFQDPYRRIGQAADDPKNTHAEERLHRLAARELAQKSIVLLKNENRLLPLPKSAKVALIGPLAEAPIDLLGSWSGAGQPHQVITLRQGLSELLPSQQLRYARGANVTQDPEVVKYLNAFNWDRPEITQDPRSAEQMLAEALEAAQNADVIIAALGESRGMSQESSSRISLELPEPQKTLLHALKSTGKPIVLVLMNGRPLSLTWEDQHVEAILETWFGGTEGGHAIADVLFGTVNPSGKLPISFPRSVGQIPCHYNQLRIGRPYVPETLGNYSSQYFEVPEGPLYPFGYGLSYTQFQLSQLALSQSKLSSAGSLTASVLVKNTGTYEGDTVVQLYIRDVTASVVRPIRELKGFKKIHLKPNEEQKLLFTINEEDLKFYNPDFKYLAEPGVFIIEVGLNSKELLSDSFELL